MRDLIDQAERRRRDERAESRPDLACIETERNDQVLCPLGAIELTRENGLIVSVVTGEQWISANNAVDVTEVR